MSLSKEQILTHTKRILVELFEVDPALLVPDASLYDDLDIDSIDTIDLLIELKKVIAKEIDPQAFKDARTIDDVVSVIHAI
ncbi:MAG: acyl carrier protein [Polaribacter sp.]|jgi:acyl carrier protein|tara:strand:+ start:451 stop:693 length:243 start_codon:yes stop_codon:yes gene_type:complete